jgi:hypothetical protein
MIAIFREDKMIAIICTDGQMGIEDLQKECVSGKWIVPQNHEKHEIKVFGQQGL